MVTNSKRNNLANLIKENLELVGISINVSNSDNEYYKNIKKQDCDILLTGKIVSIKPEIQAFLELETDKTKTKEEMFLNIYKKLNDNPNIIGLCFNSITIISSKNIKGNLNGNWYNIFYNIDNWYKIRIKIEIQIFR